MKHAYQCKMATYPLNVHNITRRNFYSFQIVSTKPFSFTSY